MRTQHRTGLCTRAGVMLEQRQRRWPSITAARVYNAPCKLGHETLTQWCLDAGLPSTTSAQHQNNIGSSMSRVCRAGIRNTFGLDSERRLIVKVWSHLK